MKKMGIKKEKSKNNLISVKNRHIIDIKMKKLFPRKEEFSLNLKNI